MNSLNQIKHGWEHVTLIIRTKLLSCDAERRARHAGGEDVDSGEILGAEISNILLDYIPVGPVCAQSGAELWLIFNCCGMVESRHFKAESLAAAPSAEFEHSVIH